MIEQNTVFIVGAGASSPFGYPIGSELRIKICNEFPKQLNYLLTDSPVINMDNIPQIVRDAFSFCQYFREARIKSIDRYLAINQEFTEIGKLAIALNILAVEKEPKFGDTLEDNWYFYLYNRMVDGFKTPDSYKQFGGNKVNFITFNYDRSLEHYFFECLRNTFPKIPEPEIVEQLKRIPIHHVYGQVDCLPWQGKGKPYGATYTYDALHRVSRNIKTMYERTEPEIKEIKEIVAKAKSVCFLGFGYDKSNMDGIGLPKALTPGHRIYGTYKNAKEKERHDVGKYFGRITGRGQENIIDCGCVDLLRQYL